MNANRDGYEQRDSYGLVAPPAGGDPVAHMFLTSDMQRTVATPDGPAAVGWVRDVSDQYLREVADGAVARHDAHEGRVDARERAEMTAVGDERYWRHEGRRPADLDRVENITRADRELNAHQHSAMLRDVFDDQPKATTPSRAPEGASRTRDMGRRP